MWKFVIIIYPYRVVYKVDLIFTGAKLHKQNQYRQSEVCLPKDFEEFRYY